MHLFEQNEKDSTLVLLTLAGNQSAYEELVVRYQKLAIAAANSITHSRFMAEDAAQDAFVTAWMKLDTLREPDKYGAWISRIARNCAKNTVMRFREYMDFDELEGIGDELNECPEEAYISAEERESIRESVNGLPKKVGQVIRLHYFEGLSIAEIAMKMRISEGTVKWHLHDGRKRIRKELCAMEETMNDTLIQRVMKKVEELKLWKLKSCKDGFETVYKNVLCEVEELPKSEDRSNALADVLLRGWWWLPGMKNDVLLSRIQEAAELGKNEEVMEFLIGTEIEKLYDNARQSCLRDSIIPKLEKLGFEKALGYAWFWLGYEYFENNEPDKGFEALGKVQKILKPSDFYYSYRTCKAIIKYVTYSETDIRMAKTGKRIDVFRFFIFCREYKRLTSTVSKRGSLPQN